MKVFWAWQADLQGKVSRHFVRARRLRRRSSKCDLLFQRWPVVYCVAVVPFCSFTRNLDRKVGKRGQILAVFERVDQDENLGVRVM